MRRTKLIWQIIPLFALIIFMCMAAFAWFSSRSIKSFYIARFSEKMSDKLRIAVDLMPSGMALSRICSELGEIEGMRITAILADGKVACDTSGEAGQMENHSSRPEFAAALRGEISSGVRLSDTTGEEMLYTAVPVLNEKKETGVLRGAVPLTLIKASLTSLYYKIVMTGLAILTVALFISIWFARMIGRPVKQLELAAEKFTEGNFNAHLPDSGSQEISSLCESMKKMRDRLEKLDRVRKDFVSNVSHELRTPVTSIVGFLEMVIEGKDLSDDDRTNFLHTAYKQSERLNSIIDDLLMLARIEQEIEKSEIPMEEVSAKELLAEAVEIASIKADQKGIKIDIFCQSELKLRTNPLLIEHAIANLLDNAIKYSNPDSSVYLNAHREANEVIIRVRDEGCGIPKEHLSRIFERFYRIDKARSRSLGGTGLGLSIVKNIASAHRGYVTASSQTGRGSIFIIHLPQKS
ncbi:MAG TPA: ATP-binding protein [bacterium]|nr:ATP-binding protein [bacterium]